MTTWDDKPNDYDHALVMLADQRNAVIEECAQELDEMVAAAKAVGTHREQIFGLISAAAAIRALKDRA